MGILGDWGKWIWGIAEEHFPGATQIVDLYQRESIRGTTVFTFASMNAEDVPSRPRMKTTPSGSPKSEKAPFHTATTLLASLLLISPGWVVSSVLLAS